MIVSLAAMGGLQIRDVKASTTWNFTLYGSATLGWGFTSASMSSPGPKIVVDQGDTVNLTLISSDGVNHEFFVSYTNASSPSSGDPESPEFSGTVNYQFVASNTTGTYEYRCAFHPDVMWGYFQIVQTGAIPEFQPVTMMLLLVASTIFAALIYKRKRRARELPPRY
jgi:plastocyanin